MPTADTAGVTVRASLELCNNDVSRGVAVGRVNRHYMYRLAITIAGMLPFVNVLVIVYQTGTSLVY